MIALPNLVSRDGQNHLCRRGRARKRVRLRSFGKETKTWKVLETFQVSLANLLPEIGNFIFKESQ